MATSVTSSMVAPTTNWSTEPNKELDTTRLVEGFEYCTSYYPENGGSRLPIQFDVVIKLAQLISTMVQPTKSLGNTMEAISFETIANRTSVNLLNEESVRDLGLLARGLSENSVIYEIEDSQIDLDDYCEPGITIDWKRARELYKRMFGE